MNMSYLLNSLKKKDKNGYQHQHTAHDDRESSYSMIALMYRSHADPLLLIDDGQLLRIDALCRRKTALVELRYKNIYSFLNYASVGT